MLVDLKLSNTPVMRYVRANSIYPMTTAVISMMATLGILFARHIDIPVMTVCDAFIIEFMACIISIGVCLIFFMLNPEKDSQTAQMLAVFMCFCIVAVLSLWTEFEAFGLLNAVVARVGILVALIAAISGCRYVFGCTRNRHNPRVASRALNYPECATDFCGCCCTVACSESVRIMKE